MQPPQGQRKAAALQLTAMLQGSCKEEAKVRNQLKQRREADWHH